MGYSHWDARAKRDWWTICAIGAAVFLVGAWVGFLIAQF